MNEQMNELKDRQTGNQTLQSAWQLSRLCQFETALKGQPGLRFLKGSDEATAVTASKLSSLCPTLPFPPLTGVSNSTPQVTTCTGVSLLGCFLGNST